MLVRLFALVCLTCLLVGCGGDASRGVNRDRDRPRSAVEKEKAEKDKSEKVEKK
jgi:hypothetical protein